MSTIQPSIPSQVKFPTSGPFFNLVTGTIIDRIDQIFEQECKLYTAEGSLVFAERFYSSLKEKYITSSQLQRIEKINPDSPQGAFFFSVVKHVCTTLHFELPLKKLNEQLNMFSQIKNETKEISLNRQFVLVTALDHVEMAIDHLIKQQMSNVNKRTLEANLNEEEMEENADQEAVHKYVKNVFESHFSEETTPSSQRVENLDIIQCQGVNLIICRINKNDIS